MSQPVLSLKNVTITQGGKIILSNVNLEVNHGEFIYIIGKTGSGKSSFMKAIGLNIILAQAGLVVACRDFTFVPYIYIFTRILNTDNICKFCRECNC